MQRFLQWKDKFCVELNWKAGAQGGSFCGGLAVEHGRAVLHHSGIRQSFIYVLFSHKSFNSTLIFACTSLVLVRRVAMVIVSPFT